MESASLRCCTSWHTLCIWTEDLFDNSCKIVRGVVAGSVAVVVASVWVVVSSHGVVVSSHGVVVSSHGVVVSSHMVVVSSGQVSSRKPLGFSRSITSVLTTWPPNWFAEEMKCKILFINSNCGCTTYLCQHYCLNIEIQGSWTGQSSNYL